MNSLMKILTGILGVLAVIACLATIGVIGYSLSGGGGKNNKTTAKETAVQNEPGQNQQDSQKDETQESPVPTQTPAADPDSASGKQPQNLADHVHDYKESMEKKATCYQSGVLKYSCECGDSYYVDVPSTGHVADDWETVRKPTEDKDGLRVKKCIYCDEIIAQETIPYKDENKKDKEKEDHVHQYAVTVEREPTCVLAGLRKHTCSCGSFYTETISALGHIATDWTVVEEPTTTTLGREQRTCTVCGVVLDSRPIDLLSPSPSPTASAAASATPGASAAPSSTAGASASPTASATQSPSPTPTPHTHNYTSYVLVPANCQQQGVRSFICSCGSSYAEPIEKDPNNHSFEAVITRPTATSQGFTTYTCKRCGYSYVDNYVPALND